MVHKRYKDGLLLYRSDILNIPHAMFARHGGCSPPPYDSLNCSYGVGDDFTLVKKNRNRIRKTLGIKEIKAVTQVHGDAILVIDGMHQKTHSPEYDALITDRPGIGLLIQQADCQAILLHDPVQNVIAAIHSGWRGSVSNIIGKTIVRMQQIFSVQARDILAVISPSLGPCCAEFINYKRELPLHFRAFRPGNKKDHFDFWAISKTQLILAGVDKKNIDTVGLCTACKQNFFSYRRAVRQGNGQTGRNCSIIALP